MEKYCMDCMSPKGDSEVCPSCGSKGGGSLVPHQLKQGTVLGGRYLVGRAIGQGGFGITYLGRDLRLDMKIAVKEYYPNGYANRNVSVSPDITISDKQQEAFMEEGKRKFLNEARVLAQFHDEPGIVDVRDFFEENRTAYIIMEYLEGQDLRNYLKQRLFSAKEILGLMKPVMEALGKIHASGIVHRDISPDNLMLASHGGLKLMDFGAARQVDYSDQKSVSVVLKAGYAPEEQYRPKGVQGPWTDIYALCATIYKCITGITPDDALQRGYQDEVKWPSELGVAITAYQEGVLKRGMSVKQEERYQTVEELQEAFYRKGQAGTVSSIEFAVNEPEDDKTVYYAHESGAGKAPDSEQDTGKKNRVIAEKAQEGGTCSEKQAQGVSEKNIEEAQGEKEDGKGAGEAQQENGRDREDAGGKGGRKQRETSEREKNGKTQKEEEPGEKGGGKTREEEKPRGKGGKSAQDAHSRQDTGRKRERKPEKGKIAAVFLGMAAIAAVVLAFWMWYTDNPYRVYDSHMAEISGEKVSEKMLAKIARDGDISILTLSECTLSQGGIKVISGMENIKRIHIDHCSGYDDFTPLARMEQLEYLQVVEDYENPSEKYRAEALFTEDFPQIKGLHLEGIVFGDEGECLKHFGKLEGLKLLGNEGHLELWFLQAMTELAQLELAGGDVSFIPASAAACTKLVSVNLNQTGIKDLSWASGCKELKELCVKDCGITDLAPLSACPKLEHLEAGGNQISDLTPLGGCTAMQSLQLDGNQLISLDGCEGMIRLENLSASDSQLVDAGGIANSTSIRNLDLSRNMLSGDLGWMKDYTQLEFLDISENEFDSLWGIENNANLKVLAADQNQITDSAPLERMAALNVVCLSHNRLASMDGLKGKPGLKALLASHNQIQEISPLDSSMDQLMYLDLGSNQIEDITVCSQLPHGKSVLLLDNNQIQDISMLPQDREYQNLALCANPVQDFSVLESVAGTSKVQDVLYFSYAKGFQAEHFSKYGPGNLHVVDAPINQQAGVLRELKEAIQAGGDEGPIFQTQEEAEEELAEFRQELRDLVLDKDPEEKTAEGE